MARSVAKNQSGFYIDGLTQAKATLANLPAAFREIAVETIDIGTNIMLTEAVARVPVRYGSLKRSIGKHERDDGLQAAVGSGDWKAKFQEFGTNDTPRQAFLWPAYKLGAKYIRGRIKHWAQEAATKATTRNTVSKGAKKADKKADMREVLDG